MDCADDWISTDKGLHFGAGAVAGIIAESTLEYLWPESEPLERAVVALIPVLLIAVAKEIHDHHDEDNHGCWKDAAATVAGGVLAVSITVRF